MPYSQDFNDEFFYSPKEEELHDVAYGPRGKSRPATVGGAFGRFLRKTVADPIRGMARSVEKARSGGFSSPEEMGRAALDFAGNLVGTPSFGSGLGSGARMKAAPWQSRTLDALLGESPVGKKFPQAANPQTWVSKLKGAGLPGEEVKLADEVLGQVADPRGKLERRQVAELLERTGLPELGVTKTELGGPKWEVVQKRLNDLDLIQEDAALEYRRILDTGDRNSPELKEAMGKYQKITDERAKLSQWAAGKRPQWSEDYHNIEELKSRREVLYHAPPKEGGEYSNHDMRLHYPGKDKNLLFHQREGILEFPDGKKSTHISEQQSDWISEYEAKTKENKKFRVGSGLEDTDIGAVIGIRGSYELSQLSGDAAAVARQRVAFLHHAGGGQQASREQVRWAVRGESGNPQLDADYNKWFTKGLESERIPEPPMKDNWWKMGLKDAVKRAVEAGHDYLTWDTPETIIKRGGDKIKGVAEHHYGNNIPGFLKKEYGVETKRVPTNKNTQPIFSVENEEGELFQFPANRIRISETVHGDYVGIAPNGMWVTEPLSSREAVDAVISRKAKDVPVQEVLQIPITEEMKRKVLLEGQYFSKQTAKPGGRDAEMAA